MNKGFFFESCGENTGRHSGISHFTSGRERERERESFFSCHREEKIDFPRDKLEILEFPAEARAVSLLVLDERLTDDGSYFSCYIFMTWNGEICERGKFPLEYSSWTLLEFFAYQIFSSKFLSSIFIFLLLPKLPFIPNITIIFCILYFYHLRIRFFIILLQFEEPIIRFH